MSKLEEQLKLAEEYGFQEIVISVQDAKEILKGTKVPLEHLNAPAVIYRALGPILERIKDE